MTTILRKTDEGGRPLGYYVVLDVGAVEKAEAEAGELRRARALAALDALDGLFISPRNSRAEVMRPWHRGIYLSYSIMAMDVCNWKPEKWQVEILEEIAEHYKSQGVWCEHGDRLHIEL